MLKRFAPWIFLFLVLLGSIPVLVMNEYIVLVKIIGFLTVVSISLALSLWRKQSMNSSDKTPRVVLNLNDKHWLVRHISFYRNLDKSERIIFENRVGLFLSNIIISESGKDVPEKDTCFYVASSAVIAYWGLPYWNYGDLTEVLVYPENYSADGTVHRSGAIQGQVHHGGLMDTTMILSLRALKHGFSNETDKKNVGVHEFAHLIDKHDGEIDGLPYNMDEEDEVVWMQLAELEIKRIKKGKSKINPYGRTNYAEFFAVTVESFKERPNLFRKQHPRLYEILYNYFDND